MRTLLRWIGHSLMILAVIAVIAASSYFLWHEYQKRLALVWGTAKNWEWIDGHEGQYQKHRDAEGVLVIRKVDLDDEHSVELFIDPKRDQWNARAYWKYECKDGTEVDTSLKDSDDDALTLSCTRLSKDFSFLTTSIVWVAPIEERPAGSAPDWELDYDGFKVDESFGWWPIEVLLKDRTARRLTLPAKSIKQ